MERSELDRYLDVYSLRIEREPVELRSSANDGEALRLDAELPAGARLRVLASDATTWGTVAAALARGCEDTRLVDPDGTILRAITPPPPPRSK